MPDGTSNSYDGVVSPSQQTRRLSVKEASNYTGRIASSDNVTESGSTPRQGGRDPSR